MPARRRPITAGYKKTVSGGETNTAREPSSIGSDTSTITGGSTTTSTAAPRHDQRRSDEHRERRVDNTVNGHATEIVTAGEEQTDHRREEAHRQRSVHRNGDRHAHDGGDRRDRPDRDRHHRHPRHGAGHLHLRRIAHAGGRRLGRRDHASVDHDQRGRLDDQGRRLAACRSTARRSRSTGDGHGAEPGRTTSPLSLRSLVAIHGRPVEAAAGLAGAGQRGPDRSVLLRGAEARDRVHHRRSVHRLRRAVRELDSVFAGR